MSITENHTSIITEFLFNISTFNKCGLQVAEIIISEFFVKYFRFLVLELQIVVVAQALINKFATGFQTILLLQIIVTFFQETSILYSFKSSIIPAGVQGIKAFSSHKTTFHKLTGENQSASFSGEIFSIIFSEFICFGKGSCTIKAVTSLLVFNFFISEINFSSEILSSNSSKLNSIQT